MHVWKKACTHTGGLRAIILELHCGHHYSVKVFSVQMAEDMVNNLLSPSALTQLHKWHVPTVHDLPLVNSPRCEGRLLL